MIHAPIASIPAYCRMIGIPAPRHESFDVRRFEDNMRSVKPRVEPLRHELFAVALKLAGGGHVRSGPEDRALGDGAYLFFNRGVRCRPPASDRRRRA